ncbi:MAG TPA: ATP-binding protein [Roseiarcus sp.]
MAASNATLHMMCGKIAAGKSTLSARLGEAKNTIVISEDRWIAELYQGDLTTLGDYFQRSDRLRATLTAHIVDLLRAGVSVVLDFHANTIGARCWMRRLFEEGRTPHQLHFLDVPDEACRARLHARIAAGTPGVSDEEFDHITSFFVPPDPSEGFNIIRHGEG